jgi:hypothetical protein
MDCACGGLGETTNSYRILAGKCFSKSVLKVQILCCWTLSIVLSLSKNTVLYIFLKHNVSETGFCLHLQVKPTQLGPMNRASPYLWKNKQEVFLDKHRMMDSFIRLFTFHKIFTRLKQPTDIEIVQ